MLIVSSAILPAAHALHVIPGRPARPALGAAGRASVRMDDTMNTVIGGAALLVGVGGGVGLIAFAENAGKQNEERQSVQPCVVCTGKMVVDCTICSGSGVDQFADLVAGVRAEVGDEESAGKVTVEVRAVTAAHHRCNRAPLEAYQIARVELAGLGRWAARGRPVRGGACQISGEGDGEGL